MTHKQVSIIYGTSEHFLGIFCLSPFLKTLHLISVKIQS